MTAKVHGTTVDIFGNTYHENNAGGVATVYPQKVVIEWNEIRFKAKNSVIPFWEMMMLRKKGYLINSKELSYLIRNWHFILKIIDKIF